jgi:hypothetical protein
MENTGKLTKTLRPAPIFCGVPGQHGGGLPNNVGRESEAYPAFATQLL